MTQEAAHQLSEQTRKRLAKEHASLTDQVEQLEHIVKLYPNDAWACGQLRYFRHRIKELSTIIGLAENRVST